MLRKCTVAGLSLAVAVLVALSCGPEHGEVGSDDSVAEAPSDLSLGDGSDGETLPPGPDDTTSGVPILTAFTLDDDAESTTVRVVPLDIDFTGEVPTEYMVSETSDFDGAAWLPWGERLLFELSDGDGPKTVYLKIRNGAGETDSRQDEIVLAEVETLVLSEALEASSDTQTVSWGGWITIEIPGSTVEAPGHLTIHTVPDVAAHHSPSRVPGAAFDIQLDGLPAGGIPVTAEPLAVTLRYSPDALVADLPPEDQVAVAWWDPEGGTWNGVPATVDPFEHTLRFETRHLSVWNVLYLNGGYQVSSRPHFRVIFDPSTAPTYLGIDAFDHAARVGSYLEDAWEAYGPFKRPSGRIDAYVGSYTDPSFSGDILVPLGTGSLEELKFDMAHEYFHAVQLERYGSMGAMGAVRWWIEASADYAAGRMASAAGTLTGSEVFMGENIQPDYPSQSITWDPNLEDRHKYHTAHFLDYLVKRGASFTKMWDWVSSPWGAPADALGQLDSFLHTTTIASLDLGYSEFASYFFFDPSSPLPLAPKFPKSLVTLPDQLQEAAAYHTKFEAHRSAIEGTMVLPERYTAKLWALPLEMVTPSDTSRKLSFHLLEASPGVSVRAHGLQDDARAPLSSGWPPLAPAAPSKILFPKGSVVYVMAVATSGYGTCEVEIYDPVPLVTSVGPSQVSEAGQALQIGGLRFDLGTPSVGLRDGTGAVVGCPIAEWTAQTITTEPCGSVSPGPGGVTVTSGLTGEESDMYPVEIVSE